MNLKFMTHHLMTELINNKHSYTMTVKKYKQEKTIFPPVTRICNAYIVKLFFQQHGLTIKFKPETDCHYPMLIPISTLLIFTYTVSNIVFFKLYFIVYNRNNVSKINLNKKSYKFTGFEIFIWMILSFSSCKSNKNRNKQIKQF